MTRPSIAVGFLILGLGLLAGAGYVWVENDLAHYGQATYAITGPEGTDIEPSSTVPETAEVIAYSDLPPKAQLAFEKARRGKDNRLWAQDDRRAVEAVLPFSGEYVEYHGEYYQILVLAGHRGQRYWQQSLVKFIGLGSVGVVLIGFGVRELLRTPAAD